MKQYKKEKLKNITERLVKKIFNKIPNTRKNMKRVIRMNIGSEVSSTSNILPNTNLSSKFTGRNNKYTMVETIIFTIVPNSEIMNIFKPSSF